MTKILLVDDDEKMRHGLKEVFLDEGYTVEAVGSGEEAIKKIQNEDYSLVITDLMMPGINGMGLLRKIKKIRPKTRVIMITAFGTIDSAVEAMRHGASDYIVKPFGSSEIVAKAGGVLEEAKFEEKLMEAGLTVDKVTLLKSLANHTRLDILELLGKAEGFRFVQIKRNLGIEDATKLSFHLRELKKADILRQDNNRKYYLTSVGKKVIKLINDLR